MIKNKYKIKYKNKCLTLYIKSQDNKFKINFKDKNLEKLILYIIDSQILEDIGYFGLLDNN